MLVKIELLILITDASKVTAYFFDRENKIVLPYTTFYWAELSLENLTQVINKTESSLIFVEIDIQNEIGILNLLSKNNDCVKVYLPLQQGILYAQFNTLPLFVDQRVLQRDGIYVTKQFIEGTVEH